MSKREVPNPNRDKFPAWQSLMMLHHGGLGDHAQSTITTKHTNLVGALTAKDLKKMKEHNQAMLEIASTLRYIEFDDIKGCNIANKCGMLYTPSMEETLMFKDPKLRV